VRSGGTVASSLISVSQTKETRVNRKSYVDVCSLPHLKHASSRGRVQTGQTTEQMGASSLPRSIESSVNSRGRDPTRTLKYM